MNALNGEATDDGGVEHMPEVTNNGEATNSHGESKPRLGRNRF